MTTLAVIGGGIVGRSLLYNLAKEKKPFTKIYFFESEDFAFPCSLHSTAVVAARGISSGISPLGDLLAAGFDTFSKHVADDRPLGVKEIVQYSAATEKLEQFLSRHPTAVKTSEFCGINFHQETYLASEKCFLIDPPVYLEWLLRDVAVERMNKFVVSIDRSSGGDGQGFDLKTVDDERLHVKQVVVAAGSYHRFWKELHSHPRYQSSKSAQGCYLEWNDIKWSHPSFSLTIDGKNLIYHSELNRLLIGSTTQESHLQISNPVALQKIYGEVESKIAINLPDFEQAQMKVGLREKASKREPYLIEDNGLVLIGGMYKNGFGLSLEMAKKIQSL